MVNETDDPFAAADGTILRPKPGGARRPPGEPPRSTPPRSSPEDSGPPPSGPVALADFLTGGCNPILQAAAPLIATASRLQSSAAPPDVASLRPRAMQEVRTFDDRMRAAGVASEDAIVARYIVCTFFDSAVLNTPWGGQSDWSGQSLLVIFHREKSGGEKFFQILERISAKPARYIDLIELQYVCLALGFEGMHRIDPRGREKVDALQHKLARAIRDARQLRDEELSVRWRGVQDKRNPIFRYLPWWMVAAAASAVLVLAYVIYDARLRSTAEPIKAQLSELSEPLEYVAPAEAAPTNRLKVLLAEEEQAGLLTVEDFGGKSVVTPAVRNLFRSGSASVDPQHVALLNKVAQALNQLPGNVIVVGHTDDQPVRSFQFADNFELSRERAVAITRILQQTLAASVPVEWVGVGATQPRYTPVETAENRERNRRVEIIHIDPRAAR